MGQLRSRPQLGSGLGGVSCWDIQIAVLGKVEDLRTVRSITVSAFCPNGVLNLYGDNRSDVLSIRGVDGFGVDRISVAGHQIGEGIANDWIVDCAKTIGAEDCCPGRVIGPDPGDLACLVGGNDEVAITDLGIPAPAVDAVAE